MKGITASVALWLGIVAAVAQAEVYTWKDAQGKVHFSDKKPRDRVASDISPALQEINLDSSQAEMERLRALNPAPTAAEVHYEQAQQQQRASSNQQYCQALNKRLKALQGRFTIVRADGSHYSVNREEQQRLTSATEAEIARQCGG